MNDFFFLKQYICKNTSLIIKKDVLKSLNKNFLNSKLKIIIAIVIITIIIIDIIACCLVSYLLCRTSQFTFKMVIVI